MTIKRTTKPDFKSTHAKSSGVLDSKVLVKVFEPWHKADCARISASGKFMFPNTKCTCGNKKNHG